LQITAKGTATGRDKVTGWRLERAGKQCVTMQNEKHAAQMKLLLAADTAPNKFRNCCLYCCKLLVSCTARAGGTCACQ
jgi:hypothetical protein